jgi:hypothetical protein
MAFIMAVIGMEVVSEDFHGEILITIGVRSKTSHLVDHTDAEGSNMENRLVIIFI